MAEVMRLAAEALGVPASDKAALRLDARVLRGELMLSETGAPREGIEVEVWVGEAGGVLEEQLDALHEQVSGYVSVLEQAAQQAAAAPEIAEVKVLVADHLLAAHSATLASRQSPFLASPTPL